MIYLQLVCLTTFVSHLMKVYLVIILNMNNYNGLKGGLGGKGGECVLELVNEKRL